MNAEFIGAPAPCARTTVGVAPFGPSTRESASADIESRVSAGSNVPTDATGSEETPRRPVPSPGAGGDAEGPRSTAPPLPGPARLARPPRLAGDPPGPGRNGRAERARPAGPRAPRSRN